MVQRSTLLFILTAPILTAAHISFFPGIGGGVSGGASGNASAGTKVDVKPGWSITTRLERAINGTVGALTGDVNGIGQAAVNGVCDTLKTGLGAVTNLGGAVGGAAAGVVDALGNGITGVGASLGDPKFGANARLMAQLKAAFEFVGAILTAGGSAKNDSVIAALRDLIGVILSAALSALGSVALGPLGTIGACVSALIDPILKAFE